MKSVRFVVAKSADVGFASPVDEFCPPFDKSCDCEFDDDAVSHIPQTADHMLMDLSSKSLPVRPIHKTKDSTRKSAGGKKRWNVSGCIYLMEDDDYDHDDLDRSLYSMDPSRAGRFHELLCALVNRARLLQAAAVTSSQQRHPQQQQQNVENNAARTPLPLAETLEAFVRSCSLAVYGDGPLPVVVRHYFALLAAERFKCPSLIVLHRAEFLRNGGDPEWLLTSSGKVPIQVPPRIRNVQELNKKMAHRPWAVTAQLISALRHCPSALLTAPQLAHAIVIFAQTHSLAVFLAGCQLYSADVTATVNQLATRSGGQTPLTATQSAPLTTELQRHFEISSPTSNKQPLSVARSTVGQNNRANYIAWRFGVAQPGICDKCVCNFIDHDDIVFHDLRPCHRSGTPPPQDYCVPCYGLTFNWTDKRGVVFDHVYDSISESLDIEFKHITHLFHGVTFFTESDDSEPLEQLAISYRDYQYAVWQYVHYLFGIYDDNCDYSKVLRVLSHETKAYIKLIVCFPNRVVHKKFSHIPNGLQASNLVELNILLMMARQNAELVYSVNALASLIGC